MGNNNPRALLLCRICFMIMFYCTGCNKTETESLSIDDKYRTYYEIYVGSFCDSDGDGIGDLKGLISKLDYLNDNNPETDSDLSVTGIWLMPVSPSDTYHKYDVNDYYGIDPSYGTVEDFKTLLSKCHERNIKVIIDFVFNHTSDTNPWFTEAVSYYKTLSQGEEPDENKCPYANYYNFTKDGKGKSSYYKISGTDWYYEGKFWSEMPDLNLDNKAVRQEIEKIASYWISLGVDGFRLDAAKEYFSGNQAKNIEVLSWFCDYVKSIDENLYCVAEVWDSFGTIASYYKSGIDSIFNYAAGSESGIFASAVANGSKTKTGKKLAANLEKIQDTFQQYNPDAIDAPFLSNHDNDRAAGYVGFDEDKVKLLGGINLMMTGNSFIYYGEEIGMTGNGKDENKRAPMQWSETNQTGMTTGPFGMSPVTLKFPAVDVQSKDDSSILNYYRRAIRLRTEFPEIARGDITALSNLPEEIAGMKKTWNDQSCYLFINTSDKEIAVTLKKEEYTYQKIAGALTTTDKQPVLAGESLTLLPYAIVILK